MRSHSTTPRIARGGLSPTFTQLPHNVVAIFSLTFPVSNATSPFLSVSLIFGFVRPVCADEQKKRRNDVRSRRELCAGDACRRLDLILQLVTVHFSIVIGQGMPGERSSSAASARDMRKAASSCYSRPALRLPRNDGLPLLPAPACNWSGFMEFEPRHRDVAPHFAPVSYTPHGVLGRCSQPAHTTVYRSDAEPRRRDATRGGPSPRVLSVTPASPPRFSSREQAEASPDPTSPVLVLREDGGEPTLPGKDRSSHDDALSHHDDPHAAASAKGHHDDPHAARSVNGHHATASVPGIPSANVELRPGMPVTAAQSPAGSPESGAHQDGKSFSLGAVSGGVIRCAYGRVSCECLRPWLHHLQTLSDLFAAFTVRIAAESTPSIASIAAAIDSEASRSIERSRAVTCASLEMEHAKQRMGVAFDEATSRAWLRRFCRWVSTVDACLVDATERATDWFTTMSRMVDNELIRHEEAHRCVVLIHRDAAVEDSIRVAAEESEAGQREQIRQWESDARATMLHGDAIQRHRVGPMSSPCPLPAAVATMVPLLVSATCDASRHHGAIVFEFSKPRPHPSSTSDDRPDVVARPNLEASGPTSASLVTLLRRRDAQIASLQEANSRQQQQLLCLLSRRPFLFAPTSPTMPPSLPAAVAIAPTRRTPSLLPASTTATRRFWIKWPAEQQPQQPARMRGTRGDAEGGSHNEKVGTAPVCGVAAGGPTCREIADDQPTHHLCRTAAAGVVDRSLFAATEESPTSLDRSHHGHAALNTVWCRWPPVPRCSTPTAQELASLAPDPGSVVSSLTPDEPRSASIESAVPSPSLQAAWARNAALADELREARRQLADRVGSTAERGSGVTATIRTVTATPAP